MYESIYTLSSKYPLNIICNALGVNKASYMYWLKNKDNNKLPYIYQCIISIYSSSKGIYGAPKIKALLIREYNISLSVSTVSRYMSVLGIKSIVRTKFPFRKSTMSDKEKEKIVNLIKGLEITHIN